MLLILFLGLSGLNPASFALDVTLLTPQGPKLLKSWSESELKKISKNHGEISAQQLIFDESTKNVELNERANIDLVTLSGAEGTARVPRFLIWRGFFKLFTSGGSDVRSRGEPNRLLVPAQIFTLSKISKIELSRASQTYPGTRLTLRTNPAASRGEKLFTQSCLACHSLPQAPPLPVSAMTNEKLQAFNTQHKKYPSLSLDAKALRGLVAYREALSVVPSEVKSP